MYCIVDCYDLIFSMYIYVMHICIVLHYVFFLISCHLYPSFCFQAPRGFCNMRYINIYYYYYYYYHRHRDRVILRKSVDVAESASHRSRRW